MNLISPFKRRAARAKALVKMAVALIKAGGTQRASDEISKGKGWGR